MYDLFFLIPDVLDAFWTIESRCSLVANGPRWCAPLFIPRVCDPRNGGCDRRPMREEVRHGMTAST